MPQKKKDADGGDPAAGRIRTEIYPEAAGFNPAKLDRLEAYFRDLIGKGSIQCASYHLSRRGKTFAAAAVGRLHDERGGDFRVDSIRMIGSITKLVTAVAVFQLWERGRFNLYTTVAESIREFDTPLHRVITVAQLLTHTSGLRADGGYFQEPYPFGPPRDPAHWIRADLEGPLQSEPGKVWAYSSFGFTVLGEIVSRVSGIPYADYVTANIFRPLKMEDTHFTVPPGKKDRVCVTRRLEEEWFREWARPGSPFPPSACQIFSTLPDLSRLGKCLLGGGELDGFRLLGRKSIEYMRRNHLRNVPAFHWGRKYPRFRHGLGAQLIQDDFGSPAAFGHNGLGASSFFVDPDAGLVSVFFVPTVQGYLTEAIDNARAIIWSGLL